MRVTISLKCSASTPNSSVVVTVTGAGAPSSAAAEIASMKRRIGRSTTNWMATVIKTPMNTSDTPASVSAQNWILPISSSERWAENFTATAPATAPSSVIGAITSQWCSLPLVTDRETTRPRCDVFGVAPVERQLAPRLVRRDERRPFRLEGEDVELEHAGTDLEQAHDELMERRTTFELTASPDGGRHLTRVDDRAIL